MLSVLAAVMVIPFAADAAATPSVDTSFGGGSITPKVFPNGKWRQVARGAVLQTDGKVVVAMSLSEKFKRRTRRPVLRYDADGTLDRSYGKNGVAWFGVPGAKFMGLSGIELQADGKTLVTGHSFKTLNSVPEFFIVRLTTAGALDKSFGKSGVTRLVRPDAGFDEPVDVHPREDGSTILTYIASDKEDLPTLDLIRLAPDGRIDSSYGNKGTKSIDLGLDEYFIEIPEIDIVGDDAFVLLNGEPDEGTLPCRVIRTNISSNGGPVATFGTGGVVEFGEETKKTIPYCSGLTRTADGGVAVSGWSYVDYRRVPVKGFVYKLLASGSPDLSFGVAGKLTGNSRDRFWKITETEDRSFLVVGARQDKSTDQLFQKMRGLARLVGAQGTLANIFPTGVVPETSQYFSKQLDHRDNGNLAIYSNEDASYGYGSQRVALTRIVKFTN